MSADDPSTGPERPGSPRPSVPPAESMAQRDPRPGVPAFFELDWESLRAWCRERDLPRYAPEQIQRWVYQRGEIDPERMTDLSRSARRTLSEEMVFLQGEVRAEQVASDQTRKLLIAWPRATRPRGWHAGVQRETGPQAPQPERPPQPAAGASECNGDHAPPRAIRIEPLLPTLEAGERRTECVMIPTEDRRTACISSQVGCPVGCRFCASGLGGFEGNLTAGRILEQVWHLARLPGVGRISHVVFMGMGEPLANLAAVTSAIRTLNAPWGFGISARRITVSTVGLPAAIRRLHEFELPITLALSLHAPSDDLRREIIPWAEYATIDELLDACQEWFDRTGREITLEYILLGGVNDRPVHALELAKLAKSMRANVNLIRYNEVAGLPYLRPQDDDVLRFQEILRSRGVNTHIRRSRGRDISAACGQLRHERRAAPASGLMADARPAP